MIKVLKNIFSLLKKEYISTCNRNKLIQESVNKCSSNIFEDKYKMYILVRRDILPLTHCAVQASHVAAEFVHYHQNNNTKVWVTCEKTIIILEATEKQINDKMKYFTDRHMNYQPFWEPDMNNTLTAVAFQPIKSSIGKDIFKNFKLLS